MSTPGARRRKGRGAGLTTSARMANTTQVITPPVTENDNKMKNSPAPPQSSPVANRSRTSSAATDIAALAIFAPWSFFTDQLASLDGGYIVPPQTGCDVRIPDRKNGGTQMPSLEDRLYDIEAYLSRMLADPHHNKAQLKVLKDGRDSLELQIRQLQDHGKR